MNESAFEPHYNESNIQTDSVLESLGVFSFEDLYITLRGQDEQTIKELTNNIDDEESKTVEGLITVIENVRSGSSPIEFLVEDHDLRKIVSLLIDKESGLIKTKIGDADTQPETRSDVETNDSNPSDEDLESLNIKTFDDLYKTLEGQPQEIIEDLTTNIDSAGSTTGKFEHLITAIEDVRNGLLPIEAITNKHGLRKLVMIIMKREKLMMSTKLSDYEKIEGLDIKKIENKDFVPDTFEGLYASLREKDKDTIHELLENVDIEEGSPKYVEHLVELIEGVRSGKYPIEAIVTAHGLRDTVSRLLEKGEKTVTRTRVIPAPEFRRDVEPVVQDNKTNAQKIKDMVKKVFSWFR